jgi:hypothetical protein
MPTGNEYVYVDTYCTYEVYSSILAVPVRVGLGNDRYNHDSIQHRSWVPHTEYTGTHRNC